MARSLRTIISKALWGKELTALKEEHNAVVAELDELKTQFTALATKLDTDFTAQNLAVASSQLDEDYADTVALSATEAKLIG